MINEDFNDWFSESRFIEWYEDHKTGLEEDWLAKQPPEEIPLDDDIPDYLDDHQDELYLYAKERYNIERDIDWHNGIYTYVLIERNTDLLIEGHIDI